MTRKPRHLDQWVLVVLGIVVAGVLLVAPLVLIFVEALSGGWSLLVINLQRDYMRSAILLTLVAAGLSVPVNVVFGILLAWCVTRFRFRGRTLLANLVNIPYAMSPVVAGLCYVVVYGLESATGRWLDAHGVRVVFAWPGIVLVTIFVTSPYVARALIPLMESKGPDEEEAALTLGARGWDMFRRVTLPNIKWGLVYGVVLTNARAVGEFGAVAAVSGAIMNQTLTLPLLVEQLNNDYKTAAAFTAAAMLALIALITLMLKTLLEWHQQRLEQMALGAADDNPTRP